jgi:hypothetical protein
MSYQVSTYSEAPPIEAGQQIAHLRHVLGLVEEIAGLDRDGSGYKSLDEAARTSADYERSLPIVRKRFDALAEETIAWAAVALKALDQAHEDANPPRAAATQLAHELERALHEIARIISPI